MRRRGTVDRHTVDQFSEKHIRQLRLLISPLHIDRESLQRIESRAIRCIYIDAVGGRIGLETAIDRRVVGLNEGIILIVEIGAEHRRRGEQSVAAVDQSQFRQYHSGRLAQIVAAVGLIAGKEAAPHRETRSQGVVGTDRPGGRNGRELTPVIVSVEGSPYVLGQAGSACGNRRVRSLVAAHQDIDHVFTPQAEVQMQLVVQQREFVIEIARNRIQRIRPDTFAPVAVADEAVVGQGSRDCARAVQSHDIIDGRAIRHSIDEGSHPRLIVVLPNAIIHCANRQRVAPPVARQVVFDAEVGTQIPCRQILLVQHRLLQQPVAVQGIQRRQVGAGDELAGGQIPDAELGGAREGGKPPGQQARTARWVHSATAAVDRRERTRS